VPTLVVGVAVIVDSLQLWSGHFSCQSIHIKCIINTHIPPPPPPLPSS
jgi:hypothetical protein